MISGQCRGKPSQFVPSCIQHTRRKILHICFVITGNTSFSLGSAWRLAFSSFSTKPVQTDDCSNTIHKVIRAPLSLFCHGTFLSIRTSLQTDEVFIDLAWERVLVKVSLHLLYLRDECEQNSWGASSNFPCQLLPQMNRERITYQASNQLNVFPKPSLLPVFTGLLSRIKSNVIGWWELDGCADRPMRCTDSSELMLDEAHLQPLHCVFRQLCVICVTTLQHSLYVILSRLTSLAPNLKQFQTMDDDPLQEASSSLPAVSDIWCLFWQDVVNLSFIICYSYRLEQGTAVIGTCSHVIRHSIRLHLPLLCIILAEHAF